jgi:hypothetical protein
VRILHAIVFCNSIGETNLKREMHCFSKSTFSSHFHSLLSK